MDKLAEGPKGRPARGGIEQREGASGAVCPDREGCPTCEPVPWQPAQNEAQAWRCLEWLAREHGIEYSVGNDPQTGTFWCEIIPCPEDDSAERYFGYAPTRAEAICGAITKAGVLVFC